MRAPSSLIRAPRLASLGRILTSAPTQERLRVEVESHAAKIQSLVRGWTARHVEILEKSLGIRCEPKDRMMRLRDKLHFQVCYPVTIDGRTFKVYLKSVNGHPATTRWAPDDCLRIDLNLLLKEVGKANDCFASERLSDGEKQRIALMRQNIIQRETDRALVEETDAFRTVRAAELKLAHFCNDENAALAEALQAQAGAWKAEKTAEILRVELQESMTEVSDCMADLAGALARSAVTHEVLTLGESLSGNRESIAGGPVDARETMLNARRNHLLAWTKVRRLERAFTSADRAAQAASAHARSCASLCFGLLKKISDVEKRLHDLRFKLGETGINEARTRISGDLGRAGVPDSTLPEVFKLNLWHLSPAEQVPARAELIARIDPLLASAKEIHQRFLTALNQIDPRFAPPLAKQERNNDSPRTI